MKGFFITGTDTGVGKTVVTALLCQIMRERGIKAAPVKPVQTGCVDEAGKHSIPDLDYVLQMLKLDIPDHIRQRMAPFCFTKPCSPHLAAKLDKGGIELHKIQENCHLLSMLFDCLLVEGAGGLYVPLNERNFMIDLIGVLNLPVILVCRPTLGTLNHTILSIRALRSMEIDIKGLVFSGYRTNGADAYIQQDNMETVRKREGVPLLGAIPYCQMLTSGPPDYTALPESIKIASREMFDNLGL